MLTRPTPQKPLRCGQLRPDVSPQHARDRAGSRVKPHNLKAGATKHQKLK
ncbi:hypothetical protein [Microcoleus sp. herbarium12]